MRFIILIISIIITLSVPIPGYGYAYACGNVNEFPLHWPNKTTNSAGSTHEIAYSQSGKLFWITGQNYDHIARVTLDGEAEFFAMPPGSRPHGIQFDADGHLWVSLEFTGFVAKIDENGKIVKNIDVRLDAKGAKAPINTHPHGLGLGSDGKTLWFTGKKTNTVGKINPDGSVDHFELPTVGAVPIYLATGPDGNMWSTELVGNKIARITPNGNVTEFNIPTYNSRPIAIVPGPDGKSMWFSEEAGGNVARIDMNGNITEFSVPLTQRNVILAGMAFDSEGNLWTHSYVDAHNPLPPGSDYIIRFDKAINTAGPGDLSQIPLTYYQVPSQNTIMHRIIQGPDGNIWFTELGIDKLGKLAVQSALHDRGRAKTGRSHH